MRESLILNEKQFFFLPNIDIVHIQKARLLSIIRNGFVNPPILVIKMTGGFPENMQCVGCQERE
ncbi:hypothetical protein ACP70R_043116 [Stipagrostis hirtigluma subsp. patula]